MSPLIRTWGIKMETETLIQTTRLQYLDILNYPEISIPAHQTVFLTGESGCGKSTLLKLFNGTLDVSRGTIWYCGGDIAGMDTIVLRKQVLLASQEVFLFDGTIRENFKMYGEFREEACPGEEKMKEFLYVCCGEFDLDSRCEVMSGGERQRVFLAICLSFLPRVLMLDEPTAALDEATADVFFTRLKNFAAGNGITLIIICHNPRLVERFADKVITLKRGGGE